MMFVCELCVVSDIVDWFDCGFECYVNVYVVFVNDIKCSNLDN